MYPKKYKLKFPCPDATIQKHEKMEKFNLTVYEKCCQSGDLRWATISLFYYALHKTQKLIMQNSSFYPRNHVNRRMDIDKILSNYHPKVLSQYMNLEAYSRQARYCPEISLKWDNEPQKSMIVSFLNQTEVYFKNL